MSYKYHIGLDVHTRNCFYAVLDRRGKLIRQGQIRTCEEELLGLVRSIGGPKALVFEESTVSQWLYLLLSSEVDKLVVCDPAAITKKPGAKNDRINAIELADLLRVDRLNPVFHTADERMELRTLVSGYNDLVQEIVRAKNRYKAIYRQSAIRLKGCRSYSDDDFLKQLTTKSQRFVAKPLLEQIAVLEDHKKRYRSRFRQNLKRFKEMRLLRTIPGLDIIRVNRL